MTALESGRTSLKTPRRTADDRVMHLLLADPTETLDTPDATDEPAVTTFLAVAQAQADELPPFWD